MTAFIDHGPGGTGEAAALLLRQGNAGSNTADDHITAGRLALSHAFLDWIASRRLNHTKHRG